MFAPKAREAGLILESTIDPGVPALVIGDATRISQILHSLVGNALKFTDRGRIAVTVTCARGESLAEDGKRRELRVFFAIADTGIGLPADKIGELFKPFSQIDTSTHRRRGGTGLGLIISKRLCELMGGSISVESRLGEGTTFRFSVLMEYSQGDTVAPFAPGSKTGAAP